MEIDIKLLHGFAHTLNANVALFCLLWLAFNAFVYSVFLRNVNLERHINIRRQLRECARDGVVTLVFLAIFVFYENYASRNIALFRLFHLAAFATLAMGFIWVTRIWRLSIFTFLFLARPHIPVPLLLMNLFSLGFAVSLGFFIASAILGLSLAPLLATSAFFSIVLGLALQDTLGNLFAGVALQIDRPYRIGDWIEIATGGQKTTGQVIEISWRATLMQTFTDEFLTLPNRLISQAQITNYSTLESPPLRSVAFRFKYNVPAEKVRKILVALAAGVPGVRATPAPKLIITENAEWCYLCKLIYYVDNFSQISLVASEIMERSHAALLEQNILIAIPTSDITLLNNNY